MDCLQDLSDSIDRIQSVINRVPLIQGDYWIPKTLDLEPSTKCVLCCAILSFVAYYLHITCHSMAAPLFGVFFVGNSYPITDFNFIRKDPTHWVSLKQQTICQLYFKPIHSIHYTR